MLAAVVVTYSAPPDVLGGCLESLRAAGGVDLVVVVDTGGSAVVADPDVVVITMENRGYGAAANAGFEHARRAGADAIALLNDDVEVCAGWLEPLRSELTSAGVGAVQPKLLVAGVRPPVVNSLGVVLGRDGAGVDLGIGERDRGGAPASDIEIFTGGAVVFTSGFIDATGGFDERYFLYYEDVDLALRGAELGWHYRVVPASTVEHRRGASTSGQPDSTRFLQERNRLWVAFRFLPASTIVRALWLSVRRVRHRPRWIHARALAAGLAGAPVLLLERRRARRSHRAAGRRLSRR